MAPRKRRARRFGQAARARVGRIQLGRNPANAYPVASSHAARGEPTKETTQARIPATALLGSQHVSQ
eukprot:1439048-Lingulodinium_polyedra.AAC.1